MKKLFFAFITLFYLTVSAQYNSLLWKISGNGLKRPSFLYGTMHTKDARVFAFGDSVIPFLNSAKAYAMELDPAETFDMSLLPKLVMGKDYSLKKMIPEREYAFLDSVVKDQIGYSVALFDNVAPVLTMTILEMGSMGLSDSSIAGNKEVLDMYFYKQAQKKRKKIIGIETVDEQLNALNTLSYREQADLLVKEIRSFEENKSAGDDMVRFYLEGNLDSLASSEIETEMSPKFYKALVTDRNERMASRIADLIKEQPTFIALGALHLPNSTGVIELLKQKGFTVKPVIQR
ncbi:MAG: TraB/GumN family protein [Bacteroidota bacterium]